MAGKFCTHSGHRKFRRSSLFPVTKSIRLSRSQSFGSDHTQVIVSRHKEVVQRSSIRGFRDDFYEVDADVVLLAGETHLNRKPVSSPSSVALL